MENVKSVFLSLICFASLIFLLIIRFMVATLIDICWSLKLFSIVDFGYICFNTIEYRFWNLRCLQWKIGKVIKRILSNKNNKLYRQCDYNLVHFHNKQIKQNKIIKFYTIFSFSLLHWNPNAFFIPRKNNWQVEGHK